MSNSREPQEISIDSQLNISQQFKQANFPTGTIREQITSPHKYQQVSLDSKIWDNSYTIINEAEQDLLDKLDDILKQHKGNCVQELPSRYKMTKAGNNTSDEHSISDYRQHADICIGNTILNNSIEELSLINHDFNMVESLFRQYKADLRRYQRNATRQCQQKNYQIHHLKEQNFTLRQEICEGKGRQLQLEQDIIVLSTQNSQLNNALRNFQAVKNGFKSDPKKVKAELDAIETRIMSESNRNFSNSIRRELESLIEMLIHELEKQKYASARLKNQIIAVQRNMLEAERTIHLKNEEMYQMQIAKIIKNKEELKSQIPLAYKKSKLILDNCQLDPTEQQTSYTRNSTGNLGKQPQKQPSFTLIQVVNQEKEVSRIEKLTIGYKIIEFYEEKLQNKDYEILMDENIIISNYPLNTIEKLENLQIKPLKIRHKKFEALNRQRQEIMKESLLYNLAFILDTLFKQSVENQCSTLSDVLENDIRTKIEKIFSEKYQNKHEIFEELKELIANCLSLERDEYL